MAPKILIDITHPAHFHFFRPAMNHWRQLGYELIVAARDKDITLQLLDRAGYDYLMLSKARRGRTGLGLELIEHEGKLLKIIAQERPDVILEVAGTFIVHAAALTRTPALVFYDTEDAQLSNKITYPFATKVVTPACYQDDIGGKHVRYRGYQELAYLHPNYFRADASVLEELGVQPGDVFSLVRFVSWEASHDWGHEGSSTDFKSRLTNKLSEYGRVFITSEEPLPEEFEPFRLTIAPEKIHDVLAFATLYVGESTTMASEAALLGTPSICYSSRTVGYVVEQGEKYGLVELTDDPDEALLKAERLLERPNVKYEWSRRRKLLLADTEDVTQFICELVEPFLLVGANESKIRLNGVRNEA